MSSQDKIVMVPEWKEMSPEELWEDINYVLYKHERLPIIDIDHRDLCAKTFAKLVIIAEDLKNHALEGSKVTQLLQFLKFPDEDIESFLYHYYMKRPVSLRIKADHITNWKICKFELYADITLVMSFYSHTEVEITQELLEFLKDFMSSEEK